LGCRRIGQYALDDGCLLVGRFLRATGNAGGVFDFVGQFVAGFDVVQTGVIVLESL
jgi:hypothetical protein